MTVINYARLIKQAVVESSNKIIIDEPKITNLETKRACEAYKVYSKKHNTKFESYK